MDTPAGWTQSSSAALSDGDEFAAVLPGATLAFSRTGNGPDSEIHNMIDPIASIHRIETGFPMIGVGQIDDDSVAVALPLLRSSEATVWDGRDASLDTLVLFGPGADHACAYGAGWEVFVAIAKWDEVQSTARCLGVEIIDPTGKRAVRGRDAAEEVRSTLVYPRTELDPGRDHKVVTETLVELLATGSVESQAKRFVSSTGLARNVVDYLESTGSWFPPVSELCEAAAASERRLRTAFVDCFGIPPTVFLRQRALAAASNELRRRPREEVTVTEVALAHGFRHLPSFSRYHREAFGVLPSAVRPTR